VLKEIFHKRIHKKNENLIIGIFGPTRSGKSWAGLKIGHELDPHFAPFRCVAFSARRLLNIMNKGHPPGTAIMWDDVGVGGSSKEWYKKVNKVMGYVLQTCGYKNYIIIITVPDAMFIDKTIRKLFHFCFVMTGKKYKKHSEAKPYWVINSPWKDDPYRINPRVSTSSGRKQLQFIYFRKPPSALWRRYERMKAKYMDQYLERVSREVDALEKASVLAGARSRAKSR